VPSKYPSYEYDSKN